MPRIFVSHASQDDPAVDALSDWLSAKGHDDHFIDHRDIPGGGSWDAVLRREAARAEMLILYVTPAWLASEECFAEYRASYYGDKTVLPLLSDGLRTNDLSGPAQQRFRTLSASVQGIPVQNMPPDGFVEEQIESAIARVAQAARAARRRRFLAAAGLVFGALFITAFVLAVTNATYVGELMTKWRIDRSFALATQTSAPFHDCSDAALCPEMIPLPAARYAIGHADGADPLEDEDLLSQAPITPVEIPAFAVSKFEITKAQWRACVLSTKRVKDETKRCKELVYSDAKKDEPVETVSWHDAQAYVGWLNAQLGATDAEPYRLLSEAEWEYAARGGLTPRTTYAWGGKRDAACDYANMLNKKMPVALDVRRRGLDCAAQGKTNHVQLSPVGSYAENAFGLYDMAGNVSEWVADCWHDSHAGRPDDIGAAPWITNAPKNCDRVLKGGSWIGYLDFLRPAARVALAPEVQGFNIGLRVARTLPE